ncbi:MAG TPA: FtsX-like permease family protein [Ideonella sp.]|nr:FtsX-like permease family protein [Ideonella sp.]
MNALLLDALHGLRSRRGPTLVAMGGLMLALAACLLVGLLAIALAEPAPHIPDPERVVMLDFKGNPPGQPSPWFTASPVSFGPMLKQRQVPLDLISRVGFDGIDFDLGDRLQPAYKLIADPDLAPLLGLESLQGDLRSTLARRDGIAITVGLLRKLWGPLPPEQALGRRLQSQGTVYTVGAVIPNTDPRAPFWPANPMVGDAMAMVGFESQGDNWSEDQRTAIYMANGRVFARLRPGTSVDQVGGWMREAFLANPRHAELPAEWRVGREAAYFRGVTLTQLPFEGQWQARRWQVLGAVAAACALLLMLAAFNAMNLQAASLLQRQRETALRRSLGADSLQLLQLWSMEAALALLPSASGALLLAWWVAPAVANWMGLSPAQPVADPVPLQALLGFGAVVALLPPLTLGVPAWAALRRAPAPALQGRTASEGPWGRRVRQGLLTLQLGGALLLLSLAGVLAMQQQHLLRADRGFDTRNRLWLGLMVNPEKMPNLDAFVAALGRHPAIWHWAFSGARPAGDTQGQSEMHASATGHKQVLRVTTVSPGFFDTYGMTVVAGRPHTGSGETNVVIDAKAARLLGFADPQAAVGALLRGGGEFLQEGTAQRRVVAVVKEVKMESAREPAQAQAFVLTDQPQWDLTVYGPDMAALRQALDEIWQAHGPPVPHDIQPADKQLADVYREEEFLTTTLAGVALLAVGVAMLGAYALVADTLRRRRTELVLRRLHGAGHAAIAGQVAAEFAWPLAAAALTGLPLAAWLGEHYLSGFVDRVGMAAGLGMPLAAGSVATVIVVGVSAWRHLRQALALQPIEALG